VRISKPWYIAAVVLVPGAIVSLSGIRSWADQRRGMRFENKTEEFYRYVAQQLDEPALCAKIPWSVESPGAFFTKPSYERSECYDSIASRTRNPWLCWKVKRLGAFSLLNDQTSMWSCLAHARSGGDSRIAIHPADLVRFFAQMGYDPDTLHLEGITPPVISVKDIYRQLMTQTDIVTRIEKASDAFDKASNRSPEDIVNSAYLADIAALVTKDSRWCFRIPEDLPLAGNPSQFRDWCLYTLASNTKNAELCRQISARSDRKRPGWSLRDECGRVVNSPYPSNLRYGPEVPVDDGRARALITMLNYEVPRVRDLPLERISDAYDRFLEELNHGTDPPHTTARRRFIDRVQRLPDDNQGPSEKLTTRPN
jgi:hypothetical protein